MRYFQNDVAVAAATSFVLTVLACFTGIRSIRTVLCHRVVGCCVLLS